MQPAKPLRLSKHGESAALVVPKPLVAYLRWQIGDLFAVELLEDRSIRFRPYEARDLLPARVAPFVPRPATESNT